MTRTTRSPGPSTAPPLPGLLPALLLGTALVAGPTLADAQATATDEGWLPWLGCWTEVGSPGATLCVRPAGEAGSVELLSVAEGAVTATEVLRTGGTPRAVAREGCEGTEAAEFSEDGRRVYLRSSLVCEGGVERRSTGLVAFVSPDEWIRVETVAVGDETAATIERYRPAAAEDVEGTGLGDIAKGRSMAVRSARMAAASRPSTGAVVEATRSVDTEAVRAWVAERGEPLDVDAQKLVRMSESGVADEVIDVVVAVSFPERFELDRGAPRVRSDAVGTAIGYGIPYGRGDGYGYRSPFGYRPPVYASPWGDPWYFGDRYGFGFAPYGYGYAGGYGWWYGGRSPTIIVVRPVGEDRDAGGRVVNGEGYRRNRGSARRPDPASSRIGSSSRGSISPGGARAGSSSGSTGRKAKRKGGSSGGGDGGGS